MPKRPARTHVKEMSLDDLEDERIELMVEETKAANALDQVEKQIEVSKLRPAGKRDAEWLTRATLALYQKQIIVRDLRTRLRTVELRIGRLKRTMSKSKAAEREATEERCFVQAAKVMLSEPTYLAIWKLTHSLSRQRSVGDERPSIAG